jgi:fatty-acyl-CoA synthase
VPQSYRDVTVGRLLTELAHTFAHNAALLYPTGPRWTFAELESEARTIARGLLAVGVTPGERVVLWATNVPEWVVLQFALAKIGAVLVTANTQLRASDIDYLLRQSEAGTIIAIRGLRDLDYVAALDAIGATRDALPHLRRRIFIGAAPPPEFIPYAELRNRAAAVPDARLDALADRIDVDAVVNMQYTSGTTGFPKGVMLSSRNIVNNGAALGRSLAFTSDDRLCLCVPLFHCFGCVIGVLGAYTHGACLCPVEVFDPRAVLETVERERCTALYGVPTMFLAELEHPEFPRFDLSSLRTGVMAGALCPEPLLRRVMTEMHIPEITVAYGMTESSPGITITPRDASIAQRSQTVGTVLPEMDVRIVDAVGRDVPTTACGELCVRGYNVMKGYYNNPDATRAAVDDDGWLHTGDEASMDADGFIRITGRIKDIIIRGGENISPKEVEDCLRLHPAIADAYVYGVPDDFFGEVVAAAIRTSPQAAAVAPGDVIAWCADRLARFKVPKHVRFVDAFPMTASGKIQKYKLRADHQHMLEAQSMSS